MAHGRTWSTTSAHRIASVTSSISVSTETPADEAAAMTVAALDSDRTVPTDRNPSLASFTTVANPIPEFAPVVSTTLSPGFVICRPYPSRSRGCFGVDSETAHFAGSEIRRAARDPYAATSMRVVVTGSTGLIGQALCSHLTGSGHHVVRVVRRPVRPDESAVRWAPEAGTIDVGGLEGVDAVVNLAGAGIGDSRWSEARKRVLDESRTRSTALLVGVLADLDRKPRVLVSASAIGIYGE